MEQPGQKQSEYIEKLKEDNKRLQTTLRQLQKASTKALQEFNLMKSLYSEATIECETLTSRNAELMKKSRNLEETNKQSAQVLKRIIKASKLAIAEFNDLKQRFIDELERRQSMEQYCHSLTQTLEKLNGQSNMLSNAQKAVTNDQRSISQQQSTMQQESLNSEEQLSMQLSSVKVQLSDTLSEFESYKEQALSKQMALERTIEDLLQRITAVNTQDQQAQYSQSDNSKQQLHLQGSSSPSASMLTLSSDMQEEIKQKSLSRKQIADPVSQTSNLQDSPIMKNYSVISKISQSSGFRDLNQLISNQSKYRHQFSDNSDDGFGAANNTDNTKKSQNGNLMNFNEASQSNQQKKTQYEHKQSNEPLVTTNLPIITPASPLGSALSQEFGVQIDLHSPLVDVEWSDKDSANRIQNLASKLIEQSRQSRAMIEKRSSRIYEAAGKQKVGSEYNVNRLGNAISQSKAEKLIPQGTFAQSSGDNIDKKERRIAPHNSTQPLMQPNLRQNASSSQSSQQLQSEEGSRLSKKTILEIEKLFSELESELGVKL
ncbi:hypothetical protein MP228_002626 [Amoeboaphelidium protococcarum]|nr:hypothetical protein MP228_002626 [Amoeboaphelidium protococcarum]